MADLRKFLEQTFEAADGELPFEKFMELALYDSDTTRRISGTSAEDGAISRLRRLSRTDWRVRWPRGFGKR